MTDEKKKIFVPVTLHLQEGDIITSKKGILVFGAITQQAYTTDKIEIVGENRFFALSRKEEVDIKVIK